VWLLALLVIAADSSTDVWANRTEAGAVRVREAATALSSTAGAVSQAGRLEQLGPLRDQADELVRRTNLLVEVAASLPSPEEPKPPPRR